MAQIVVLRKSHFFSIDNDIIDVHAKTIGATALAVYTVLSRYANRKTGECWPSMGRLAHLLDLARNTVKAALRTLEQAGLIAIRRRRDPAGDATSHLYTLLDCAPNAVDARLTRRHAAAVAPPEGGRSADDPPLVTSCPTGRLPIDPEPSSSPQPKEDNQVRRSGAEENPPPAAASNPCLHPLEEQSYFGAITVCQHCWALFETQAATTSEGPASGEEGQAHATCAA
jgi:hypothetical protein